MATQIYDINNALITGFYAMNTDVKRPSRVISAPIETGESSFDNKVLDPAHIAIKGIVMSSDMATIRRLEAMYESRAWKFFKIEANGYGGDRKMILQNFSRGNDSRNPDWIECELIYVEAMIVQTKSEVPANSENSDTVNAGFAEQQPVN